MYTMLSHEKLFIFRLAISPVDLHDHAWRGEFQPVTIDITLLAIKIYASNQRGQSVIQGISIGGPR